MNGIYDSGGEEAVIAAILGSVSLQPEQLVVGPGDDAAVLAVEGQVAVTTDMLSEGVHFRLDWMSPGQAGLRAAVASISDAAAMGATPAFGFLSLGCPDDASFEDAVEIGRGVVQGLERDGAALAGGDVVRSSSFVVNVALVAKCPGRKALRSGAKPGDVVCVTGRLGGSLGGLLLLESLGPEIAGREHHAVVKCYREPYARVRAGEWLAAREAVHSMMDLSDGLASDLPKLACASGVGAIVDVRKLPLRPGLNDASRVTQMSGPMMGLAGGEDFELLFTVTSEAVDETLDGLVMATGCQATAVGEVTEGEEVVIINSRGQQEPMPNGFEHFRSGT